MGQRQDGRWGVWERVALLLGVLVCVFLALVIGPVLVSFVTERFTEQPLPPYRGMADMPGEPRYRLFDHDGDGAVDCFLRMPSVPWFGKGYRAGAATRRCRGAGVQEMPGELRPLLDELLTLRRELRFPHGVVQDVNGDGRADCLISDGTWRFAPEATCPDLRSDSQLLAEPEQRAADRVVELERRIRSGWLEQG